MAGTTAFWNRRGVLDSCPTDLQVNSRKERADSDVIINTISRLGSVHHKLKLPQLWSEVAIIKALIYKNGNQHRKEKYFQGLKRVVKCLNRVEEIGIYDKVADVRNKFPRLSKHGALITETLSNCPSFGLLCSTLGYLTGTAELLLQVMSTCQETFQYSCAQMAFGYFVTFHLTCSSSLSRIWVLVRSFLLIATECYNILSPWVNILADPEQIDKSEAKHLPRSITWLETWDSHHARNNRSHTPSQKSFTPGTIDKLFASTPRQNPEESSPRLFTAEAESGVSHDLGDSFIPDEVSRPLKDSEALVGHQKIILKRKLFTDNAEIAAKLHNSAGDCFVQNADVVADSHKETAKLSSTEGKAKKHTKKQKANIKVAWLRSRSERFTFCKKVHIYSDKRWRQCKERVQRKKQKRKLGRGRQKARNAEDTFTRENDCETNSSNSYKLGEVMTGTADTGNLKCNNFSEEQLNAEANVSSVAAEDFVENQTSLLSTRFQINTLNLNSRDRNSNLSESEKCREVIERIGISDDEDEIDCIFSSLI